MSIASCWKLFGFSGSLEVAKDEPLTDDKINRIWPRYIQKIFMHGHPLSRLSGLNFSHLTSLRLRDSVLEQNDLSVLRKLAPRLQELWISESNVDEQELAKVLGCCTKLTELRFTSMETTVFLLEAIAKSPFAKSLRALDLSRIVGKAAETIASSISAGHPENLEYLSTTPLVIDKAKFLKTVALYQMPDPLLVLGAVQFFKKLVSLESLSLGGRRECTNEFVARLVLPKLKILFVIGTGCTEHCKIPGVQVVRFN